MKAIWNHTVWYTPHPRPKAQMVRARVAFWNGVKVQ